MKLVGSGEISRALVNDRTKPRITGTIRNASSNSTAGAAIAQPARRSERRSARVLRRTADLGDATVGSGEEIAVMGGAFSREAI
ncbi:hypothetical protein GCM10029964_062380 [Kibdelosporangium lantanae]